MPSTAVVLRATDTHGTVELSSEGELEIDIQASDADVKKWLGANAPWGSVWKILPPSGVPDHLLPATSSDAVFDAQELCCSTLRWHNGELLVIDPTTNQVFIRKWDY